MGNEAAAMAQEAEQSKEIIHYLATNTFLVRLICKLCI